MEWMNRGGRPTQPNTQTTNAASSTTAPIGTPPSRGQHTPTPKSAMDARGIRILFTAFLFLLTILVVAVVLVLALSRPETSDSSVDKNNLQAVFLNGGQVYFGNIKPSSNEKTMRLSNIYYLRVNQQVQPNQQSSANQDISLVKLGCELHGPQDQMVINRDQIVFWENLKRDGQVAQAVTKYIQQNPKGQNCAANTSSNAAPAGTTTTPTPSLPSTNAPTTTTTTTTKKP
ncbi:MAG: hypothetical protein NVSMB46_05010 [Candidatus Saccharimonadales bacterium]